MATELASAYITLMPSLKGAGNSIKSQLSGIDMSDAGRGLSNSLLSGFDVSGISGKLDAAAKIGLAGIAAAAGAASTAVMAIGKEAFGAYSSFQQLEGGVKKLYGTGIQSMEDFAAANGLVGASVEEQQAAFNKANAGYETMMTNAQNAWKSVGVSANDYITGVTSFSAAMLDSVGGDSQQAAELVDKAMQDIADNANTFGVYSVQELTGVYKNLAKGNYLLLDNLMLGFKGSKEGMEDLLAKAGELTGKAYDINNFSDITEAIHVVQKNLGIAGTTAAEAEHTLTGSINATKAAWQNLLIEFGKTDGDLGARVRELSESATTMLSNMIPTISRIGESMGQVLPFIVPKALELGGALVGSISNGVANALPGIVEGLATAGSGLVEAFMNEIKFLPTRITTFFTHLQTYMKFTDFDFDISGAIDNLVSNLSTVVSSLSQSKQNLVDELSRTFGDSAKTIVKTLADGVVKNIPSLHARFLSGFEQAASAILDAVPVFMQYATQLFTSIIDAAGYVIPQALENLVGFIGNLASKLAEAAPGIFDAASNMFSGILSALVENLPSIIDGLVSGVGKLIDIVTANAPGMILAAAKFILSIATSILQSLPQIIATLVSGLGSLIREVASKTPDMVAAGLTLLAGLWKAIGNALPNVMSSIRNLIGQALSSIRSFNTDMLYAGMDLIGGLISGIASKAGELVSAAIGAVSGAIEGAKALLGIASPSKLFKSFGEYTMEGFAIGINQMAHEAERAMEDAADRVYKAASGEIMLYPNALNMDVYEHDKNTKNDEQIVINLNYNAGDDANEMLRDLARVG